MQKFSVEAKVSDEHSGARLDQVAAVLFSDFSRSRLQSWIKQGKLLVDGNAVQTRHKLLGGEVLSLDAELEEQEKWHPEELPLDIIFEDESLLIINKPVGLVVHPAAGNYTGTLLNALLYRYPELNDIPRAGIVHRLDKDTSGLMVVAKTLSSHNALVEMIQAREFNREYQAVCNGLVTAGGMVEAHLGRHPVHRKKRAVVSELNGKHALTHYRVMQKFRSHTHLSVKLETGRTHQIRVHMTHIGFPLVGDALYGGRMKLPKGASPELISFLTHFKRQALHAWKLGFVHPELDEYMEWEVAPPVDMQELLTVLANDNVQ